MQSPTMQMRAFRASLLAVALMGVVALAACGGGGNGGGGAPPPPPPPPAGTGITVFPGTTNVSLGGRAIFSAYVPSAPSTTTFTWAVTGGSANGTITTDGSGNGVYLAPATLPAGSVTVTVTSGNLGGSATLTITAASAGGVAVSPASVAVPAGTTFQFSATVNGAAATVTSWQVNGANGGDSLHGAIDSNGNFTAPLMPPPDGPPTITAITASGSATASATVVFSNNSLSGPYAFSYTGDDGTAFLAVAGSLTANSGTLTGGEDATDTATTSSKSITGVYAIGPDGRGTITIAGGPNGGETWQIAISASQTASPGSPAQHALLVRFDLNGTGSGTLDLQNTGQASSPFPAGNYAFGISGIDGAGFTDRNGRQSGGGYALVTAGKFVSNGNGATNTSSSVWDVNDAGFSATAGIVTNDTSLTATFSSSPSGFAGSVGRGTLTLFSTNTTLNAMTGATTTSTFQFVFYVVDNTHVKLVESDGHAFLSGDVFSAPGAPYAATGLGAVLKNGNYAFTLGGASSSSPYAAGGVFASNGGTLTSTGVMDINNGGVQISLNKTLTTSYSVDTALGRVSFTITPTGGSPFSFAGYTTSSGSVEMIETDHLAIASGVAFPQTSISQPSGTYVADISGASASGEQDAAGRFSITSGTIAGTLDFNNAVNGAVNTGLSLLSGTAIAAPDANGRGTVTLATSVATFPLVYYVIDGKTVLLLEKDGVHVVLGTMAAQF